MTDPDLTRCIALVVDDDPDSLRMVADALETNGITALVATGGAEALALLGRITPDVILLDAVMPGLDGFETCRRLKAPPIALDVPVIFMTGLSQPEDILQGLRVGGVDYLTKPLILDELLARVTVHVRNARLVESARRALDGFGRMVIGLNARGEPLWCSPRAQVQRGQIADALLGMDGRPRPDLSNWLAILRRTPVSAAETLPIGPYLLTYLGSGASGEFLLGVTESDGRARADLLATSFGLTGREGEVLEWLAQGKTNAEIGAILSLSPRTVNKHLEQIFQKMGVDNRTSAALRAERRLSGA